MKHEITPMEPIGGVCVRGPYAWMKPPNAVQEHGWYGDAFEVAYWQEPPDSFTVDGVTYVRMRDNRHAELFGTPERAARTLGRLELETDEWCGVFTSCDGCVCEDATYGCVRPDKSELLEWLEGRAERCAPAR